MCNLITHSLALWNVKTFCENSKFIFFDRLNVSLDWSKLWRKSYQTFWITWSILDTCLIDRKEFSIGWKFKKILHKLLGWLDQFLILVRLIKGTFDRSKGIFNRLKLKKLNFFRISPNSFQRFSWTNYHHINIIDRIWDQNFEFQWCYSLRMQSHTLNIKLNNVITTISVFLK